MIFLIDDNLDNQQIKKYEAHYLFDDTFSDILEKIYKIETHEEHKIAGLLTAKAILLHNGFSDVDEYGVQSEKSSHIRNKIEQLSENHSIPLVLFSGKYQNEEVKLDNDILPKRIQIDKGLFYGHLYDFLEHYKNKKEIELKIIAHGKLYELDQMLRYFKNILAELKLINKQEIFRPTHVNLKTLKSFYQYSKIDLKTDFDSYLEDMEDREITVFDFVTDLERIKDKSIRKYG